MNADQLKTLLNDKLSPTLLEIEDQSRFHAGHEGAKSGGGHFKISIASPQFTGKNDIACHRLVYAALDGLVGGEIHALQICIAR